MDPLGAIAGQVDDLPGPVIADGHAGQQGLQRLVGDVRQDVAPPKQANSLLFLTGRHMSYSLAGHRPTDNKNSVK